MAANDKEVLVKADHVKVYFKGKKRGQTVKAVDDVSFEIMKGETFGVVGESGCGKSTLGRTLIRLQQPTDGHIYLNGTDIAGLKGAQLKEMRKEAQIIFQDPSACLNPRRTIKQILMEPFEIHNLKDKIDVDAKIMELLQLVGLDSYHLSRYPHELSGGQKQRIGIARALALEPQIIICDEAVSALDVSVQAQVLNLLQELKEKLGVCLDTCHVWDGGYDIANHLDEVLAEFDRVIGLNRLRAIHLNDSLNPLGAHKDRHARIGEGCIGQEALIRVVQHPALKDLPFYLETPNELDGYAKEIALMREQAE